jgi:hypothetical protein
MAMQCGLCVRRDHALPRHGAVVLELRQALHRGWLLSGNDDDDQDRKK